MKIKVIIPAFNEENAVGKVIEDLPKDIIDEIIVVNNASTDDTSKMAKQAGATVLEENRKGYGSACLRGLEYIHKQDAKCDIVVFIDADYSDYPEQLRQVVQPILNGDADLVIGSRAIGNRAQGAMTIPQIFGNWLATKLLKLIYGVSFTDLGPFRAIEYSQLKLLNMADTNYGWTVEMQVKAAKEKLRCVEVPVDYRQRIGFSKISGTIKGTVMAGYKILWTIFKYI